MTAAVITAALFFVVVISLHLRTRQRTHFHAPTIQTNSFCFGSNIIYINYCTIRQRGKDGKERKERTASRGQQGRKVYLARKGKRRKDREENKTVILRIKQ